MHLINGFACRNCGDEELARHGIDPAHPQREFAGNEVYVSPPADGDAASLGVNRPSTRGNVGRHVSMRA
jgi:hypothetical protein